jgi:hypothetical protein
MRNDAFRRSASCHIADLMMKEGVQGNTSHGRQDKSADPGLAHVVGWVDVFSPRGHQGAGAPARNTKQINAISVVACLPLTG